MKDIEKELENTYNDNMSNNIKNKKETISNYIDLIEKIREKNILNDGIQNRILENKGNYNAYDIENWLLVSDTSARNQLKRMFTEQEYQEYIRTQKHATIDAVKELTEKRGGTCHTDAITNAKSRLHLECAEGHHFFPTYDSVVYQDTWCPDCHTYLNETICRNYFERIFEKPFPKSYPEWLINEKGNQMELDGYNKELELAFEYQGIQHREKAFGMSDQDLQNRQRDDKLKQKLCEDNNVSLLQIPDDKILPYDKMQDYIQDEYKKKTGINLENIPKHDYREFNLQENIQAKKFRVLVEDKGGFLVTPYFSAKKDVSIICENGHEWTTTPNSIYQGNWCSHCSGNIKGETKFFQEIGNKFACKLTNEYVNAKTPLWYECPKGHKFKKSPYWLKKDNKKIEVLCPNCKLDKFAEKFQNFVNKKGGSILTNYQGRFKPIEITCKKNYKWKTTPGAVYQGSWCKSCKKK